MDRIGRLRREMRRRKLDNFLVTRLSNIRYLCGFSGSAGVLLVTPRKARFFSDFRYKEQAARQIVGADVIIYPDELMKELRRRSYEISGSIGFEGLFLDVTTYNQWREIYPQLDWTPTTKLVEQISSLKDPEEIELIRRAVKITDDVFAEILKLIKPGVSELDLSAEISYLHKKKGADGDSFQPIIASGPRSALPHGIASDRKIKHGDMVTVDMGCFYQGYASDLTRTVAVGKISAKMKAVYNLVLEAQSRAIAAARSGLQAKELDEVARSVIREGGHGEHFGHGLGHGLGLEVHSEPRVSFLFDDVLKVGQIITIEPGIYLPDVGGVRIEDDVLLKNDHAEVLTQSPRELIIL
jgi:Xaa-Pro aminopeptidase